MHDVFDTTNPNGLLPVLQLYTILSSILFLFFLPLILLVSLLKKKYRGRILQRLGLTLHRQRAEPAVSNAPIIWIHALSVGEVTSALPLIIGLRQRYPEALLYFSTTTGTGQETARQLTKGIVDAVFFSPFDFFFSLHHFIHLIRPSLFILIETDLWPGWLYCLQKRQIPALLVNGRFSQKSLASYHRFRLLFRPMFNCFSLISMQTDQDAETLHHIGIPEERITTLGNLKFDAAFDTSSPVSQKICRSDLQLLQPHPLLLCGSTHRGEEEIILTAFLEIKKKIPDLHLLIAPRDINRTGEIEQLAREYNLTTARRSRTPKKPADILILDTLGELASCYQLADIALIGGSLVPAGGHNPLEAASCGRPVLFGPFMDDFSEISRDLIAAGGAQLVTSGDHLAEQILLLLRSPDRAAAMGGAAKDFVRRNQGVVQRHLDAIEQLLNRSGSPDHG